MGMLGAGAEVAHAVAGRKVVSEEGIGELSGADGMKIVRFVHWELPKE